MQKSPSKVLSGMSGILLFVFPLFFDDLY